MEWKYVADLPYKISFHDAAMTSEGCMYIFGGKVQKDKDQDTRNRKENMNFIRSNKPEYISGSPKALKRR